MAHFSLGLSYPRYFLTPKPRLLPRLRYFLGSFKNFQPTSLGRGFDNELTRPALLRHLEVFTLI